MADESDGIEEALEGVVRLAVTAGARIGAEIARAREEQLRAQRLGDEREAARLAQRFEAERQLAVAELSQVHRPDWWDRADRDRIGQTYATARAWAPHLEEAARAERRMREEMQSRYGVDASTFQAQIRAEQQARAAEPKFSVYAFKNESDSSDEISKDDALRIIDRLPVEAAVPADGRGGLADVRKWKGKDLDVDRAIAAKFPQLMTDDERAAVQAAAERQRVAAERVEAALLLDQAAREDRRGDAARDDERSTEALASEAQAVETQAAEAGGPGGNPWLSGQEQEDALGLRAEAAGERAAARDSGARGDATAGEAERLYDSAERRAADVQAMEGQGVERSVAETRMRADTGRANPAALATAGAGQRRAPKARKARRGRGAQVERAGVER